MALAASLALTACENRVREVTTASPSPTVSVTGEPALSPTVIGVTVTPEPPLTAPAGSQVGVMFATTQVEVTLNGVEENFTVDFHESPPGTHLIRIDVTIKNISSDLVPFSEFDFVVADETGLRYQRAFSAALPGELTDGELNPAETVRGKIVFEIPDDSLGLRLLYAPSGRALADWQLE